MFLWSFDLYGNAYLSVAFLSLIAVVVLIGMLA
jgi:hypothetical protein